MGERDRLRNPYFEAGSIQGDEMKVSQIYTDDDVAEVNANLSRVESENAELRAALETLLYRATELPQYATHDGLMNAEAIAQARAILERTKK